MKEAACRDIDIFVCILQVVANVHCVAVKNPFFLVALVEKVSHFLKQNKHIRLNNCSYFFTV